MSSDAERDELRGARANQAAAWFLRLNDDDVAERELSEWLDWCRDPENLREFQRTRNAWRSFDQLGDAAAELLEALLAEKEGRLGVRTIGRTESALPHGVHGSSESLWRRKVWMRSIAATLVVAIAVSGGWYAVREAAIVGDDNWSQRIPTQPAIQSSLLPDGSGLTLAPSTAVTVDFQGVERKLALSHGDAYFDVEPDKSKPFVVQAGGLRVTAIGTAFDVRARTDRVTITVEEGIVEVMPVGAGPDRDAWRVSAGHQISYDVSASAARIAAVDPKRALAWREGRLEYFSEPLGSVVVDIGRYSGRTIEIGDPQLARMSFTGTVFTAATDDWLAALESTFPVRVVVTRDDHVLLLRRSPESATGNQ